MNQTAALALLLLTACAGSAGQTWHRFETQNVILKTNASKERGEALVRDLEKFRTTLGVLGHLDFSDDHSPKLRVFAFDSNRQYVLASNLRGTGGFYTNTRFGPVSMIDASESRNLYELNGRGVLLHEYTHHLLHHYSPFNYPTWYDEGFAEFVATIRFDGAVATLGAPAVHRLPVLQKTAEWLKVKDLVTVRNAYIVDRKRRLSGSRMYPATSYQYAQGWLLTHMLHNTPRFSPGLGPYLEATSRGDDESAAFEAAFGVSFSEMDAALHNYWQGKRLAFTAYDMSEHLSDIEVDHRVVPVAASEVVILEAKLSAGYDLSYEAADAAFKGAIDLGLSAKRMAELRAQLALNEEEYDALTARIDDLEAIDPGSALGPVLRAHATLEQSRDEDGAIRLSGAELKRVHGWCREAIKRNPYQAFARSLFANASLAAGTVTETDAAMLTEALELSPSLPGLGVTQVRVLAALGRREEAVRRLKRIIGWAHRGSKDNLQDLLEALEREPSG